ncbi:MAG: hypothetical protein ACI4I5_05475 [Acutalibacteraceae bacterium]
MESTLKVIQTFSKIGKIASKVLFVLFTVGACFCVAGTLSYALGVYGVLKVGGMQIHGILEDALGAGETGVYMALISSCILCAGQAILCKFAEKYFESELRVGTPFTEQGAREMQRLGILTMAVSLGCYILAKIVCAVLRKVMGGGLDWTNPELETSLSIGVTFIIVSFLLKYGAEREKENAEN